MKFPEVSKRFTYILNERKMSAQELADRSGVGKSSISHYVNGSNEPHNRNAGLLAPVLGVDPQWLMGFDVPMVGKTKVKEVNRIPILGKVTAGIPIEAIEDIIDYEEVDDRLASIGSLFGLRIKGNSMEPRICDGDVVIVHKTEDAGTGDTVIATINGDDAVCKKLYRYGDTVLLRSNNPAYEDIDVTGRNDFRIIGKVVELRGKL